MQDDASPERDCEGDAETVRDGCAVALTRGEELTPAEPLAVIDALGEREPLGDAEGDSDCRVEREPVADVEGDRDTAGDREVDGEPLDCMLCEADSVMRALALAQALVLADAVPVRVRAAEMVDEGVGKDACAVPLDDSEPVRDGEPEVDAQRDTEEEPLDEAESVCDSDAPLDAEKLGEPEVVPLDDGSRPVAVGGGDGVASTLSDAESLGEGEEVGANDAEVRALAEGGAVCVALRAGVAETAGEAESDSVALFFGVDVSLGDGAEERDEDGDTLALGETEVEGEGARVELSVRDAPTDREADTEAESVM